MNTSNSLIIKFVVIDEWDRLVFKGSNGRYYKTIAIDPYEGFFSISDEEQKYIIGTLHTVEDIDDQPVWPVKFKTVVFKGGFEWELLLE